MTKNTYINIQNMIYRIFIGYTSNILTGYNSNMSCCIFDTLTVFHG